MSEKCPGREFLGAFHTTRVCARVRAAFGVNGPLYAAGTVQNGPGNMNHVVSHYNRRAGRAATNTGFMLLRPEFIYV